jgi:O-methyltransferase involved in polyketide biosynthesis
MAEEAVDKIGYDFSRTRPNRVETLQVLLRSLQLDRWTMEFLNRHPKATVLQLGSGFHSRVYRIGLPDDVKWVDLDYADVIGLRRQLFPDRPGCQMIASSVTERGWIDDVPADQPVWVVAEGLTYYLSRGEMKTLLNLLTGHFSAGEIAFDAVSHLGAGLAAGNARIKATGAEIGWWIDDPRDVRLLDPRLELVTEPRPLGAHMHDRLSCSFRMLLRVMELFPSPRTMNRLLRDHFERISSFQHNLLIPSCRRWPGRAISMEGPGRWDQSGSQVVSSPNHPRRQQGERELLQKTHPVRRVILPGSTALSFRLADRVGLFRLIVHFLGCPALVISEGAMRIDAFGASVLRRESPNPLSHVPNGASKRSRVDGPRPCRLVSPGMHASDGHFPASIGRPRCGPRFYARRNDDALRRNEPDRLVYNVLLGACALAMGLALWRSSTAR